MIEARSGPKAVALETAFLTSGLPADVRLATAQRMASAVSASGVVPAFTGVVGGRAIVGLKPGELDILAGTDAKLSTRDLPAALARGGHGGTTVAAAAFLAHSTGLHVAATGGIGGVHLGSGPRDESADLGELARTPIVQVCSGAKAIVDLAATLERLETLGVAVAGYQTDELPAFWSAQSGLQVGLRVEGPEEVAEIWAQARRLEVHGALLVCVPPPADAALSRPEVESAVAGAYEQLETEKIAGPAVTPYLLARIAERTEGRSLRANLALLENNARVAGEIARVILRNIEHPTSDIPQ
jgi:pseudouridine-5'-phosphate glycosidase